MGIDIHDMGVVTVEAGKKPRTVRLGDIELTVGYAKDGAPSDDEDKPDGSIGEPNEPLEGAALVRYLQQLSEHTLEQAQGEIDTGNQVTRALVRCPLGHDLDRALVTWAVTSYNNAATLYHAIEARIRELDPEHVTKKQAVPFSVEDALKLLGSARAAVKLRNAARDQAVQP